MESQNKEIEIDVNKCLRAIKKQYKAVVLGALVGILAGIFVSFFIIEQRSKYVAVATVYSMGTNAVSTVDLSIQMTDRAGRIKSIAIAEKAELILGDDTITEDQIYDMVTGEMDTSSLYSTKIYIKAYSTDKKKAIDVANAVSEAFISQMISEGENDIQILDNASESTTSLYYNASKRRITIILLANFIGVVIACGIISFKEVLSTKMYTAKDATLNGTLDIIGVIPEFKHR